MKKLNLSLLTLLAFFLFACNTGETTDDQSEETDTSAVTGEEDEMTGDKEKTGDATYPMEKNGIRVSVVEPYEYENAGIKMAAPHEGQNLPAGEVGFKFEVSDYELGIQTPDAGEKNLAVSDKGQHIHLIIDNNPYSAHYEPTFEKEMKEGNHVILAFLARSYHLSVKNDFVLAQVNVGGIDTANKKDLSGPLLFYSRPKGTYKGKDAKKVLLDFFLVNTDLSPDGHKVRATINGTEFMFTKWQPYAIEGVKKNQLRIKLELLDKDGNLVDAPFNPSERTVELVHSES